VDVVDKGLLKFTTRTSSKMDDMLAPLVRKSLRVTIVVLALIQIATSLSDKPVTSLLAGLGVGGLAVALAAQDTLKNFFGSLVIFSDKPFDMGDRVIVDGHDGTVAEVGFRSTRIRTLEGNLVTIPNGELANKTILNIGKRPHIRRIMDIGLTYSTPPEKISRAVEIITEILDNHEGMKEEFPPRVYFNAYKDYSLNIFVIYWYHPPNYWDYMAFSEKLNLEILRRFNAEGIEFAFPTQTVHLSK
jgi:MscS family membrane protein